VKIKKEVNTMEKEKQVAIQGSEQKVLLQNGDKEVSNVENLKIKHYWYNAFIIQNDKVKIAIDPGQNLWLFSLGSLIPKSEWSDITHILVTHGDPDHHYQTDRVAEASGAPVICGKDLVKRVGSETLVVAPRGRGVKYDTPLEKVYPLDVGEAVTLDGVTIEGLKAVHGPIVVPLLGRLQYKQRPVPAEGIGKIVVPLFGLGVKQRPGPDERVGLGAIGFKISIGDKVVVNLGDTLLQKEWEGLRPDVLMIPIGGMGGGIWTMDEADALEAVRLIQPKKVIPCHYNASFIWIKNAAPADAEMFRREVEKMGIECTIMKDGDEILV
jgi:L-ascorbate metabolism protein UlaG (beta-lactamase superfamily)